MNIKFVSNIHIDITNSILLDLAFLIRHGHRNF